MKTPLTNSPQFIEEVEMKVEESKEPLRKPSLKEVTSCVPEIMGISEDDTLQYTSSAEFYD